MMDLSSLSGGVPESNFLLDQPLPENRVPPAARQPAQSDGSASETAYRNISGQVIQVKRRQADGSIREERAQVLRIGQTEAGSPVLEVAFDNGTTGSIALDSAQ